MSDIQTDVLENMRAAVAGKIKQLAYEGKTMQLKNLLYVQVNDFDKKPNIATLNQLTFSVVCGYRIKTVSAAEDGLKGIYVQLERHATRP